jgi:ParB family transcriptional regulator, chromosome partitioning protein
MSHDMPQPQRDAIFDTSEDLQEIVELDLTAVRPDPNQPRQFFDEEDLEELASSIREHGQLVPILVRPDPNGERSYIIIGGERRYRAFERLGRPRIQGIIRRDVDEKKSRELALVDNLQRVDLSPFEEAAGYQRLIEEFDYTQEEVAERVGKGRTTVTQTLSLNRLPERIKQEARTERVNKSKLIELAQLESEERQLSLWEKIKKGATVRAAREAKQEKPKKSGKASLDRQKVAAAIKDYRGLAQRLSRADPAYFRDQQRDYERLVELHGQVGAFLEAVKEAMQEARDEAPAEAVQEEARL